MIINEIQCDRCGSIAYSNKLEQVRDSSTFKSRPRPACSGYNDYGVLKIDQTRNSAGIYGEHHLCQACMYSLRTFIKNEPKE